MRIGRKFLRKTGSAHTFFDKLTGGREQTLAVTSVFRRRTQQQTIEVLKSTEYGLMLVLDEEIQCCGSDEEIYHTYLIQPAIDLFEEQGQSLEVLLLGGADGFALRKLLISPHVKSVILVDHDQELVELFAHGELGVMFGTADGLCDPRTTLVFEDAGNFLRTCTPEGWQFVVIDLTDQWEPNLLSEIAAISPDNALIAMHGAAQTFQTQERLMGAEGLEVIARWEVAIPSFGEDWAFVLCAKGKNIQLPLGSRWLGQG
jgi:spermidine synthase